MKIASTQVCQPGKVCAREVTLPLEEDFNGTSGLITNRYFLRFADRILNVCLTLA